MASAEETSLNEIWRDWGLRPDPMLAGVQVQAIGALKEWLSTSDQAPENALRAVQAILLDPERPGAADRPCVKPIHDLVIDFWKGGGTHEHFVVFLQAMLLAAWPGVAPTRAVALAHLLRSAFMAMRGRDRQAPRIQAWLKKLPENPSMARRPALTNPRELLIHSELALDPFPQKQLKTLTDHAGAGWNSGSTLDHIVPILTVLAQLYQKIPAAEAALIEQLNHALSNILQPLQQNVTTQQRPPELDLLWWGEAGYSHHLRRPLRRIADVNTRILWASLEAAERSRHLLAEPAASFLVETLRRLELDVDRKRPLLEWMRDLHAAIGSAAQFPAVQPGLAALAREDALGLPVTWVRMHASERFDDEAAREGVGLALDVDLDMGDFAGLMFRECLLGLRLSEVQ